MNAVATVAKKTTAVCITITRAEGPSHLCGKTRTFAGLDCWTKANAFMRANMSTFPESGYDKHDFMVVFSDGETYEGRLDAKGNGDDCDVQAHVREQVQFMAGVRKPSHMRDAQYQAYIAEDKAEAVAFLAKYDLG